MFAGNPNQTATPAPFRYDQSPLRMGYTNPYGYGIQRVLGQLAVQPNLVGLGQGTNTTNPFSRTVAPQTLGQHQHPFRVRQRQTPYGY